MTAIPSETILRHLAQAIFDKKGFNIVALDVRGISSMTDFFLIAEGNVERHVKALAKLVEDVAVQEGLRIGCVEGMQVGDWVVIDCWQIIIHLFIPSLRHRYQIEHIWREGEIIDLHLNPATADAEFELI